MVHSVIYGLRGWIAFVAFIEFSNAIRCFVDEKQFLEQNLFSNVDIVPGVTGRLLGRYFLLNGVILSHCALFIDHLPVISITISSLSLSMIFYLSETLYYYTSSINFYVIFPTLISLSTIICLFIAPIFIEDEPKRRITFHEEEEEEDEEVEAFETQIKKSNSNPRKSKVKIQ